jgi:hypothetical protein
MNEVKSHKHHYVPVFYLKGFTNEDGHFYVYDKVADKIKKAHPKGYFYGLDRNTGTIGDEQSTMLEDMFTHYENITAPHFEIVKNCTNLDALDMTSFFHVLRFIHSLYWRVPENDAKLEELIDTMPFSETGFDLIDKKTGKAMSTPELQAQLKSVDLFRKTYRIIIPFLSSRKKYLKSDYENWRIYTRNEGCNLTGDFPIILDQFKDFSSLNEEIIFPLSKNKILVHTKRNKPASLPSGFKIPLDMLILQQSTRYVCCNNEQYLKMLVKDLYSFSKNFDFRDKMKDTVFGFFG